MCFEIFFWCVFDQVYLTYTWKTEIPFYFFALLIVKLQQKNYLALNLKDKKAKEKIEKVAS